MEDDTILSSISTVLAIGTAASLLVLSWIVVLAPHIYRIFKPSIVAYPWGNGDDSTNDNNNIKAFRQTVVFAASYNPPHHGHLRMLEYLSKKYDKVVAVVGFNPNKKYFVSPEDRADLLRKMLESRSINAVVEVVEGYIWRYGKRIGATLFFRGIRSWEKDGNEERYLQILNTWGPFFYGPLAIPIPTIYIQGDPKYNHVSSTLVRTICDNSDKGSGRDNDDHTKNTEALLSELVPSEVAAHVAKLYGGKL